MKRILVIFMSLGLIVASFGTSDAKRPARVERTIEGRYQPYPSPVTGCNEPFGPWVCMTVQTRATEAFFTAKVTDAHGQPVYVEVYATGNPRRTFFCGETKEPIAIRPGTKLSFYLVADWPQMTPPHVHTDCPTNRVKTTGTIRVTLSNVR